MPDQDQEQLVIYATPADGVARITLNRPDKRNAQNAPLLYALDAAFQKAARDNDIRCIILDAAGADFSAGHDLSAGYLKNIEYIKGINPVTMEGGFDRDGAEGMYATEQEIYLDLVKRIRNLPKPTIAAVQGKCIAAGLMLAWACDLIIASEEATFMDPVVTYGMPGVEWFAHPYELGIRKAKQMLFTSDKWTAADAKVFGMVNEVVARDALTDTALAMASKIATKPTFALRTVKEAINRAADHPGIQPSIEANMPLHHLAHQHNMRLYGRAMDPTHVPGWSAAPAKKPAE